MNRILMIIFSMFASLPALADTQGPRLEMCQRFIRTLPAHYIKGFVTVPEDYLDPSSPKIQIFYYGRLEKGKTPILFFNGGPVSSSHTSFQTIDNLKISRQLSVIYMDQRGTGCSSTYPLAANEQSILRLTKYGSTEIVKDAEVIRKTVVGNIPWKIYGQSYGSLIVHRYISLFPESLTSAYAHGYAPMEDTIELLKIRMTAETRISELYFKKYPNDEQKLTEIKSQIGKNRCLKAGASQVCGPAIIDTILSWVGFLNYWDEMHQQISELLPQNQLSESALNKFIQANVLPSLENKLFNMAIGKRDFSDTDSDSDECRAALQRLNIEGLNPEKWVLNSCNFTISFDPDSVRKQISNIHVLNKVTAKEISSQLKRNPHLKFFLYSSQFDPFSSPESFLEEVDFLSPQATNFTYRLLPNSGHEGCFSEDQIWNDILNN